MNANELRIGNYFHPCDTRSGVLIPNTSVIWTIGSIDKFGKIAVIDYDKPNNIYLTVNECSPITLTEEWLLKFGFKQYNEWYYEKYPLTLVGKKYYDTTIHDIEDKKRIRSVTIQYVHTLQNLYFALTGNELQIK